MKKIYPVVSRDTPRRLLTEHFRDTPGELPIRGGWGYTMNDACIIDKEDPIVDPKIPFHGTSIEYIFAELRTYEELIFFRDDGEKFYDIKLELKEQRLLSDGDRSFDQLIMTVQAIPENDWNELKSEFEGPLGISNPNFDLIAFIKKREGKTVSLTREFWFDITSFFGK